jgi:transcription initiation factor TFIIB
MTLRCNGDARPPETVSELGLGPAVERAARELAGRAVEIGVTNGRNPAGVAAGCVYAAAGGHAAPVTQVEIGREAGVSEFTVRKRWEEVERL